MSQKTNQLKFPMRYFIVVLLSLLLLPVVLLEYFAAVWIWAGDGTFNLWVYPLLLLLGYGFHHFYIRKTQGRIKNWLIASSVFLTPIVAAILLFAIAWIFGIDNHIE